MSIEAMKQWAEGVSKAYDLTAWGHTERAAEILRQTRDALRTAIEQAEKQDFRGARLVLTPDGVKQDGWMGDQPAAPVQDDMPKIGCVNHDCDQCKAAAQPAPVQTPITEEMHVAAVKVLHRANGVDGLPQRMLDAMLAVQPAAPVQEKKAYAWVYVNKYGVDSTPASKEWCEAMASGHGGSMFALYTTQPATPVQEPVAGPRMTIDASAPIVMTPHPAFTRQPTAQRQWVGLTDEQIEELFQGAAGADEEVVHRFARAIEAKLREKNGGQA